MTQSVSQIRSDIEATKEQISHTVESLEERLHEMKDWHSVVDRYPLESLAISVGLGMILGGAYKPLFKHAGAYIKHAVTASASAYLMQTLTARKQQETTQRAVEAAVYNH